MLKVKQILYINLKIVMKEADETEFWLFLCNELESYPDCIFLLNELSEILKILNKIIEQQKEITN